jgi:hypothetical protein
MRSRRPSWEFVACYALHGEFMKAFLVLHAKLHNGSRFPSYHCDHLLVTFSRHGGSIHTHDLIPMPKSCFVSRPLRMDHADIQDGWIADPLGSHVKGNADDTVRECRLVSMPIRNLAFVLVSHG